jgi:hypothetical protein
VTYLFAIKNPLAEENMKATNELEVACTFPNVVNIDEQLSEAGQGDTGNPKVPAWLTETVCSKKTIKEKREEIELALECNDAFLHWALMAMYDQQTPEEKRLGMLLIRDRRGFTRFDGELFAVAHHVNLRGTMTQSDKSFCRIVNKKGRSKVGKYGMQLIALIMAASCPNLLTPRLARYLPPQPAQLQEVA